MSIKKNSTSSGGFTLVEIAIVLTIIALLVGGILVGKDLIRRAELVNLMSERDQLLTGVSTFKSKYDGYPGDITNAETIWGTDPGGCPLTTGTPTASNTVLKKATCNGNGDGLIGGEYNPTDCTNWVQTLPATGGPDSYEMFRFWQQLSNANLIWGGPFTGVAGAAEFDQQLININTPSSRKLSTVSIGMYGHMNCTAYGSDTWFNGVFYNVLMTLAIPSQDGNTRIGTGFLTPLEAYSIDKKLDDGRPGSGTIMTQQPNSYNVNCVSSATPLVPSSFTYMIGEVGNNCSLVFNQQM